MKKPRMLSISMCEHGLWNECQYPKHKNENISRIKVIPASDVLWLINEIAERIINRLPEVEPRRIKVVIEGEKQAIEKELKS